MFCWENGSRCKRERTERSMRKREIVGTNITLVEQIFLRVVGQCVTEEKEMISVISAMHGEINAICSRSHCLSNCVFVCV